MMTTNMVNDMDGTVGSTQNNNYNENNDNNRIANDIDIDNDVIDVGNNHNNNHNDDEKEDGSLFPGIIVNLKEYPPPPIIWMYQTIDTVCWICGCNDWRTTSIAFQRFIDTMKVSSTGRTLLGIDVLNNITTTSMTDNNTNNNNKYNNNDNDILTWFSEKYKAPSLADTYPKLLSYPEFVSISYTSNNNTNNSKSSSSSSSSSIPPIMTMNQHIQFMYKYSFETSSTCLGSVGTSTSALVLFGLVILLRQLKQIIVPYCSYIGKELAIQEYGTEWIKVSDNTIRIQKFGEYCFRLLYHFFISIYGILYFQNKSWWTTTTEFFYGFPYHEIEPGMAWYYLFQAAYNIDALYSLLTLSIDVVIWWWPRKQQQQQQQQQQSATTEKTTTKTKRTIFVIPYCFRLCWKPTVRGDFNEMFLHHIATNGLVLLSSVLRLNRIGSMVFLLHDISDVPVDLSKLANFLKWKLTTLVCFLLMVLTWLYTRLYLFPAWLWYGSYTYCYLLLRKGLSPIIYLCYRDCFLGLMGLLILLHATWFIMFIKMFLSIVLKWEFHDYSEHKKGEKKSSTGSTSSSIQKQNKQQQQQQQQQLNHNGVEKTKEE